MVAKARTYLTISDMGIFGHVGPVNQLANHDCVVVDDDGAAELDELEDEF